MFVLTRSNKTCSFVLNSNADRRLSQTTCLFYSWRLKRLLLWLRWNETSSPQKIHSFPNVQYSLPENGWEINDIGTLLHPKSRSNDKLKNTIYEGNGLSRLLREFHHKMEFWIRRFSCKADRCTGKILIFSDYASVL